MRIYNVKSKKSPNDALGVFKGIDLSLLECLEMGDILKGDNIWN